MFRWLAESADLASSEMLRTFNCGIAMVLVVAPDRAADVAAILCAAGETVIEIGELEPAAGASAAVRIDAPDAPWRG